ncbi:Peptidase inhibitor 15 [Taenia crassiceps]|uniref:Peptidase inhibitor 15 n=1 Tax=Taenia crassiceps TaxID=6207 RepID=A0ABR4Q0K6_9CEST
MRMFAAFKLPVEVFSLIVLLLVTRCQPTTDTERAQILEYHLRIREKVWPPATNMQLMKYSMHLEHLADYWASRCVFKHPDSRYFPHYHEVGQNLAIFGARKPTFTEAVCGYAAEEKNFFYYNRTCRGKCGHYTQIIWASTNQLGCAMRRCDGIRSDWDNPQYLSVCQYLPEGNKYRQRPYEYGRSCSGCSEGQFCYRNQCSEEASCTEVYPLMGIKNPSDRLVPECEVYRS